MKFLTVEQLNDKLKNKKILNMSDLIQVIEEEFEVTISVQANEESKINVEAIAKDSDIIRQIKESKKDRIMDRTYSGEKGLKFLQQKIKDFNNGTKL
ncbi:MAG: hypothetical protein VR72_18720 [Clostridiaceae bacterium BRH_c20a]|nr:MAG: hypothetical protein VR72_18720 [Clostridiaceae bacterium BRH_c20a]